MGRCKLKARLMHEESCYSNAYSQTPLLWSASMLINAKRSLVTAFFPQTACKSLPSDRQGESEGRTNLAHARSPPPSTSTLAHSVPVYSYTLTASSSLPPSLVIIIQSAISVGCVRNKARGPK